MFEYLKTIPHKYFLIVFFVITAFFVYIVWTGGSFSGFGIDIGGPPDVEYTDHPTLEDHLPTGDQP